MRFLLPIIIIGALIASEIAFAAGGVSSSSALPLCRTKALERRTKRLIRIGRPPRCQIPDATMSSSRSSSSSSRSSSRSSSSAASLDPLTDVTIHSQFLLLGETGPVAGAAKIFMDDEPLSVTSISVALTSEVTGLDVFLLYDADRRFLGSARLDPSVPSRRFYKLTFIAGRGPEIEKRLEYHFYARPVLQTKDFGGLSNQQLEIDRFVVEGNGIWSSSQYTKATTETFPAFLTARSVITGVTNALPDTGSLSAGPQRTLGSFVFRGRTTDAAPHIAVESLTFSLALIGGVSVSNVMLGADGAGIEGRVACTLQSSQVTCTVPDTHGRLEDGPRTLTLYGDVVVPAVAFPSLRVILNQPGSISSPGSVTWNDGSSTFQWVPVESPVADGTLWK